jgi:hypothetical protein
MRLNIALGKIQPFNELLGDSGKSAPKGGRGGGLESKADKGTNQPNRLRQHIFLGLEQEIGRCRRQDDVSA